MWFLFMLSILISIRNCPVVFGGITDDDLVPFGSSAGDVEMAQSNDGSSPKITLDKPFKLFGNVRRDAWINTNGAISFSSIISSYMPSCTPAAHAYQMVSPYWADADNAILGGGILYRQTTDQAVLNKVQAEVANAFPSAAQQPIVWAFVVTFYKLAQYGTSPNQRNTMQAVLATNDRDSFVIFYYSTISWMSSSALAGFDSGDGQNFYHIDGSCSASIVDLPSKSNVNKPGVFVFRTDQSTIITPGSAKVTQAPTTTQRTNQGAVYDSRNSGNAAASARNAGSGSGSNSGSTNGGDGSGTMSTNRCYITKPKCRYDANVAIGCADGIDGEPRTCVSDNLQCLSRGKCKTSIGWCLPTTQDMNNFNKIMNKCF